VFFDTTMVMAEEPSVRASRLGLLSEVARVVGLAGDFSKVVV
jgi:glycyl-tRNA synthetase beta subunit